MVYLGRAVDGRGSSPLVAIKRPHRHLASDKNFLAMLLDEARLASAIVHENVVRVRELGFHDGEPFIVLDYIEGASLSELWKELSSSKRAFDLGVAVRVVLDALAGLHAAHELSDANGVPMGIVHRDISPHNVLVGSDGRARLTDFGIAQATDRFQQTQTHEVKGKLAYLAPERIDRRRLCTRQSDVFSMAIVLWECLAGRRLFRGEQTVDTLQEVLHLPIPTLRQIGREIPPALDDAIARALSRDLATRFATAEEFSTALASAAGVDGIASADHVARLVEALYGVRMTERCEQVRLVLHDDAAAEALFRESGLRFRARGREVEPEAARDALHAIAPPAPTERDVFAGAGHFPLPDTRRTRWALLGGVAAGLLVGVAGTLFHLARARPAPRPVLATSARARAADVPAEISTSPVTMTLPFVAARVTVDDQEHTLDPPTDIVQVPALPDPEARHHIVVTGLDGLQVQADFSESDGGPHLLGPGFVSAVSAPVSHPRLPPPARSAGVGVIRNGFTKLR